MLNKHGGKVRLTFKLENDQLWLSTKERTEKLPMGSIKNIVSEPIEEHAEYHIMVINFCFQSFILTILILYFIQILHFKAKLLMLVWPKSVD